MPSPSSDLSNLTLSTFQKLTGNTQLVGNNIINDLSLFISRNDIVFLLLAPLIVWILYVVLRFIRNRARRKVGGDLKQPLTWFAFFFTHMKGFFILAFSLYSTAHFINLTPYTAWAIRTFTEISIVIQVAIYVHHALQGFVGRLIDRKARENPTAESARPICLLLTKTAIWVVSALLVLEALDVDITALLAGLGIGGIAIALAAKNILADLFASISIIIDNPFRVGEKIESGDIKGTVEYIGMKTTQVRAESGELMYCPNGILTNAKLRNLDRVKS